MASIDNRVVSMKFDNAEFHNKVSGTLSVLDKLKEKLSFTGAGKGLSDLNAAAGKLDFQHMASSVDAIKDKFSVMSTVAVSAINQIVIRAMNAGQEIISSLSLEPLKQGFDEYNTNMGSIQTILANTTKDGTNLDQVNAALKELNDYSDQTIYKFADMAKSVGRFTSSGVDLDTSVAAIKGFSNAAAIGGADAERTSLAMVQLSQAMSGGTMRLQEWRSIEDAGIGNDTMRRNLFETAKVMGTLTDVPMGMSFDEWEESAGRFSTTLEQGWLTSDVLAQTLQTYTGDLSEAQLIAMGYSKDQAVEMMKLGALGVAAATEVKTIPQLFDTIKETIGSGWSESFKVVIGDFEEAKGLLTFINNVVGKVVGNMADARNNLLRGWKFLGGRDQLIRDMAEAFSKLGKFIKAIGGAWRDVFPALDGFSLGRITASFGAFVKALIPTGDTLEKIKSIFRGVFSILSIGWEVVKNVVGVFKSLFATVGGGAGGPILSFFAKIGDGFYALQQALVKDGGIDKFFTKIKDSIDSFAKSEGVKKVGVILGLIGSLFKLAGLAISEGFSAAVAIAGPLFNVAGNLISGVFERLTTRFGGFLSIGDKIIAFFTKLTGGGKGGEAGGPVGEATKSTEELGNKWSWLESIANGVGKAFSWLGDQISKISEKIMTALRGASEGMSPPSFSAVGDALSVGILAGIAIGIKKLYSSLTELLEFKFLDKFADKMDTLFNGLTTTLKDMQMKLKSEALLNIAIAIAVLTASLVVLSLIDSKALSRALIAVGMGMGELGLMLKVMSDMDMSGKKLAAISMALIAIGAAVFILSLSLLMLSTIDPQQMAVGLLGIAALLAMMVVMIEALDEAKTDELVKSAIGIGFLGLALLMLVAPIKLLSMLEPKQMILGIIGVGLLLAGITIMMKNMPTREKMISTGIGIGIIAASILLLVLPVTILGKMDYRELLKGMGSVILLIAFLAEFMEHIDVDKVAAGAITLLALAVALGIMVIPVMILGGLDLGTLVKGIGAMFFLLLGLGKVLEKIDSEKIGKFGIGMALIAASIKVLADSVKLFGEMDLGTLAKGLGAIAVMFLIIGLAILGFSKIGVAEPGMQLILIAGAIFIMGAALKFISEIGMPGIIIALIGLGGALIILALAALLFQGPLLAVIVVLAESLLAFGLGLMAVGAAGFLLAAAFYVIVLAFKELIKLVSEGRDAFIETLLVLIGMLGKIASAVVQAINMAIMEFINGLPAIIQSFGNVIDAILKLLIEKQPAFFKFVGDLIENMLNLIRDKGPKFLLLGWDMFIKFLQGIRDNIKEMTNVVIDILLAFNKVVEERMPDIVNSGANVFIAFLDGLKTKVPEIAKAATELIVTMINSMSAMQGAIIDAGVGFIVNMIDGISRSLDRIITAGTNLVLSFLLGIGANFQKLIDGGVWLAGKILDGMADGAVGFTRKALKVLEEFMLGMENAIRDNAPMIHERIKGLGSAIIDGMVTVFIGEDAKNRLGDAMWKIAEAVLGPLAGAFKVNSPSKETMAIGESVVEGLALGIEDGSRVENSSRALGDNVVSIFKNSIANIANVVEDMEEFNPIIAPVLDLSDIRANAGEIDKLMGTTAIGVSSTTQARVISADSASQHAVNPMTPDQAASKDITFHQHITAPTALRTGDIYRATRSQLALAKEAI